MEALYTLLSIPLALAFLVGCGFAWTTFVSWLWKVYKPVFGRHAEMAGVFTPVVLLCLFSLIAMQTLTRAQFEMGSIAFVVVITLLGIWAFLKRLI